MYLGALQIGGLVAIGLAAGVLGGLLGVGGGILMIPALTFIFADKYGPNSFHVYNLAAISTSFVLAIPAAIRHTRAGAVIYPFLRSIVPLAVVGVVAGVLLSATMTGERTRFLKQIFGGFLEFVVLVNLVQEWIAKRGEPYLFPSSPMPRRWGLIGLLVGLPAGFIAGLLGVGGGIWAVPSQSLLLGIRVRNAIATSMVMIIPVALVAAVSMAFKLAQLPHDPPLQYAAWWLTLCLAPGALLGGWCGASLMHRLPVRLVRYIFYALLSVTGLRLLFP